MRHIVQQLASKNKSMLPFRPTDQDLHLGVWIRSLLLRFWTGKKIWTISTTKRTFLRQMKRCLERTSRTFSKTRLHLYSNKTRRMMEMAERVMTYGLLASQEILCKFIMPHRGPTISGPHSQTYPRPTQHLPFPCQLQTT